MTLLPDVRPLAIICYGNIGAGKSTISRALAHALQCNRYSSDDLRMELFNGKWTKTNGEIVFGAMRKRAIADITLGRDVVLDSTGQSPRFVNLIRDLRGTYKDKVRAIGMRITCGPQTWEAREPIHPDRPEGQLTRLIYERSLAAAMDIPWSIASDIDVRTSQQDPETSIRQAWTRLAKLSPRTAQQAFRLAEYLSALQTPADSVQRPKEDDLAC